MCLERHAMSAVRELTHAPRQPGFKAIYGNTLNSLVDGDNHRPSEQEQLGRASNTSAYTFSKTQPVSFNPYPKYNSPEWDERHAAYVPCLGPNGKKVQDIRVFKGHPEKFPNPGFGSYSVLGLDRNLCFERETRLGQYGLSPVMGQGGQEINWDKVNWGSLQRQCVEKNAARFAKSGPKNEYVTSGKTNTGDLKREAEDEDADFVEDADDLDELDLEEPEIDEPVMDTLRRFWRKSDTKASRQTMNKAADNTKRAYNATSTLEPRTALLLRSFSGKNYTENDKQVIRSLITELNLRSGGEFEVFLFVHIKENDQPLWSKGAYQKAVDEHVPEEFRSIAVLWNEPAVDRMYTN